MLWSQQGIYSKSPAVCSKCQIFFDLNIIELTFLNQDIIFRGGYFGVFRFSGQVMGSWIYFGLFFPRTVSSSPSELFAPFLKLGLWLWKSLSVHTLFYPFDGRKKITTILHVKSCLHYFKLLSIDCVSICSNHTKYNSHFLGRGPDTELRVLCVLPLWIFPTILWGKHC